MSGMIPPKMGNTISRTPAGMTIVQRFFGVWTLGVLVFLYLPIVLLVMYSFNRSELNIVWTGATMHWYAVLWSDAPLKDAMENSLILASIATAVSVPIGTAGAWLLHRYRFPFGKAVLSMVYLPILMPDVIMGVSLMVLFLAIFKPLNAWSLNHGGTEPFNKGWVTLILAHVTFCFPFVLVAVQARLKGLDPSLEEAAMDLGATPSRAFASVVLPYLFPAIVSGALMAFTLSMDELIVSTFTHGPESVTLPLVIFGRAHKGFDPSLNAISTVFIVVTAVVMCAGQYFTRAEAR